MFDARYIRTIILSLSLVSIHCLQSTQNTNCECSLYLKNELWLPKYQVMALRNDFSVDCTEFGKATEECKKYCSDEMAALYVLYETDPTILDGYPPSQNLPCEIMPKETASFSKVCGSETLVLSSRDYGPPVCCNHLAKSPHWCGVTELQEELSSLEDNSIKGRDLDLKVDQNDESQNEIDDTPVSDETKPTKTQKQKVPILKPSKSWMQKVMKYFGYKSIGEAIRGVDIFSLPGKVQYAIKRYQDEVAMGRCYMEFTTFKVFTKQESPFEGFLRKKRDVTMNPVTRFDVFVEGDYENDGKDATVRSESVEKIVGGLTGILEGSESTRQYAGLLNSLLPLVTQVLAGGQGGASSSSASPLSMLLKFAGPMLLKMGNSRPTAGNNNEEPSIINALFANPGTKDTVSSAAASPMASLLMNVAGSMISNMFSPPTSVQKAPMTSATTVKPAYPSTRPPQTPNLGSSGLGSLIRLFMNGMPSRPAAVTTKTTTPKPVVVTQDPLTVKEKEEKRFIDMVLELIRPVFISILGTAPGESGVKAIRRASSLSTLGRVDDNQREEVDSPLFCLKRYMVNKAWTVTENGVRTVLYHFSPEEKSRMMQRML